jgi:glycosyltransferase involved in cell wall biosynthesis
MKNGRRFLFYSQYAFYKPLYSVFKLLCAKFNLQGFVITHERTEIPKVYDPKEYLTHESAGLPEQPDFVTLIPKDAPLEEKLRVLKKKIGEIKPDFIWAHEEPSNFFVNHMLRWFYRRRTPRIVVAVVENLWPLPGGRRAQWSRFRRRHLWRRYDGALASASKSAEAIRAYGMPASVPISIAWLPTLLSHETGRNEDAPFLPQKQQGESFVGFAGRITAAKGWRVLLAAIMELPEQFKCLIAGTGDEESELRLWCQVPAIRSKVHYLGCVEKDRLWSFYRSLDVLVLPSLTTSHWTEQFGSALAEAMGCGVPVIGSNSGGIPEVVGDCGIIVDENNSTELARAILCMATDASRRARYVKSGLERFEREFSVVAYAAKLAESLGITT